MIFSSVQMNRYSRDMPSSSTADACDISCSPGGDLSVEVLRSQQPSRSSLERAAELFRLVGDPTRLALLRAIADAGELCVCDLAAVAGVNENAVSQALRLLRTADVVRSRREGRRVHYRLADGHVQQLIEVTLEHVEHLDHAAPRRDELTPRR
jgi:DNA-binding transcriptional ArsR family regulator